MRQNNFIVLKVPALIWVLFIAAGCGNGVGAWSFPHGKGDSAVGTGDSGSSAFGVRDPAGAVMKGTDAADAALPRWKTLDTPLVFAGVWVNESYVARVKASGSPLHCQNVEASCIEIPDSTLEATCMVGGFHDGGPTMVVVKDGAKYQFYDPALAYAGPVIEPMGADRLRIGKDYFRRLQHPNTKRADFGILEELLFGGKFVRVSDGSEVVFDDQGRVTGLPGVSVYEPQIDYVATGYRDLDVIDMGEKSEDMAHYTFRFAGDTLTIREIKCIKYSGGEHACLLSKPGAEMWKLVRK